MDPTHTIESLLNCAVCLEPFERPKLLRCGHSFCLGCLEQIVDEEASVITCPLCKAKTIKPGNNLGNLPDDFRANQIKDGLAAASRLAAPQQTCDVCRSYSASVKCLQCHKVMCVSCLGKHNKRQEAARHTILKVEDVVTCADHDDDCSQLCKTCKKLVCVTCAMDKCSDHKCLDICDAVRECITSRKLRGKKSSQILEEFHSARDKQLEVFEGVDKQIQSHSDKLVTKVKAEAKRLKDELATMKEDTLEKMDISRLTQEEDILHLESLADIRVDTLLTGIPSELLNALPALEATPTEKATWQVENVRFVPAVELEDFELGDVVVEGMQDSQKKGGRNPFRFERIVHDRRSGNSALVTQHGDFVVRNNFIGKDVNDVDIYGKGDREFAELARLANTFDSIFAGEWQHFIPNIRAMSQTFRQYCRDNNIHLMSGTPFRSRRPSNDSRPNKPKFDASRERPAADPAKRGPPKKFAHKKKAPVKK